MKIPILLITSILFLMCKAPDFLIGMSEADFKSKNKVELVQASRTSTIYKKVNYPFGQPPKVKFFYFVDGKLDHVDEGESSPDIIIQHKN